jgi:acyl-ACP thioesterase
MADVYEVIFRSSDIDFNRHVTTTRYMELAVDSLPLELYDRAYTRRFEIAFRHEARWGEAARVITAPVDDDAMDYVTSVALADGTQLCSVRHTLQPVQ